jgi:hypothetical protein
MSCRAPKSAGDAPSTKASTKTKPKASDEAGHLKNNIKKLRTDALRCALAREVVTEISVEALP